VARKKKLTLPGERKIVKTQACFDEKEKGQRLPHSAISPKKRGKYGEERSSPSEMVRATPL